MDALNECLGYEDNKTFDDFLNEQLPGLDEQLPGLDIIKAEPDLLSTDDINLLTNLNNVQVKSPPDYKNPVQQHLVRQRSQPIVQPAQTQPQPPLNLAALLQSVQQPAPIQQPVSVKVLVQVVRF